MNEPISCNVLGTCMLPSVLSIVATPIGNLRDITLRAIDVLKRCDVVVCEDTRVTGMLLKHLEIPKKELISFHGYSDEGKLLHILNLLEGGKHLALTSDAGTPGISDPGYAVASRAAAAGVKIEVVPGPAAFLAALSASGLPIHRFRYLGFPPLKKGRKTWFSELATEEDTVVFYESVHRIKRTLGELHEALANQPTRPVIIGRELTKLHEEHIRTTVEQLPQVAEKIMEKGEFVVVVGNQ
jgi:16S rRNA (cytidine1402-2'-O)-methyltransferase